MDISNISDWSKPLLTASQAPARSADKSESTPSAEQESNATEQQATSAPASREDIEAAVGNIQEFVQSVRRNINFSLDDSTERVVVKVTDALSGEVIRQIPSEEALKLAESLSEARSLLFTAQV